MLIQTRRGFTLIELLIVTAIVAILLVMALPNFYRMRVTTRKTICMNNLRQIEASVDRWVFENDIEEGAIVSASDEEIIYSYLRGGKPECPSGGVYTIGTIGTWPQVTCNIEGHTLVDGGGSSGGSTSPTPTPGGVASSPIE